MSLSLSKGHKLNLSKHAKKLSVVKFCLGWELKDKRYDLDATAFGLFHDSNGQPRIINEDYVVFYNQPQSPDGAIVHSGDDRDGGDGVSDNEIITVNIDKLHMKAREVSFLVTIFDGREKGYTFGQVKCFIRLVDATDNEEIARYNLEETFIDEILVQVGSLYKEDNGDWYFKAIGAGSKQDLRDYCIAYGATVE